MIFAKNKEVVIAQKVEKDPVHIASFLGLERADIIFFLAKMLEQYHTEEGYRNILLIDNSNSQDLFEIFNKLENFEEYQINRLTAVRNIAYSKEYFDQFSYVLVYHGMDADQELLSHSQLVVLSTDYNPVNYQKLGSLVEGYDGDLQIIFRDWINKKLKDSMIEERTGIERSRFEMRSTIKFNQADYNAYILLLQNGNQRLKKANLSDLFLETLKYLSEKITGADEKTVEQLYNKAR